MSCDLNPSEEQRQIVDAASAMLATHFPLSRLGAITGDDLAEIATFGTYGLALPEAEGGAGFSLVEEAALHVLLGRHLVSTRALAAAIGARLLVSAGDVGAASAVLSGGTAICFAVPAQAGMLLVDRGGADFALVFDGRELTLVTVADVASLPEAGLGGGAGMERLQSTPATVVDRRNDAALLGVADLLIASQLLGIAEAVRDLAVDYAKARHQFGQPIGGFQAIKHHSANMAIAAEMVSAQLDMAAIAARDGRDDAPFQIAALRRLAQTAALGNVRTAIQVHGGIGFSAEADLHHFLKRAHLLCRLGEPAELLTLPGPLAPHRNPLTGT